MIQTGVCARQEQDRKAKTAARRRPSRRARFSAATRTYLASVPESPGYKVHSSADVSELPVRMFMYGPPCSLIAKTNAAVFPERLPRSHPAPRRSQIAEMAQIASQSLRKCEIYLKVLSLIAAPASYAIVIN